MLQARKIEDERVWCEVDGGNRVEIQSSKEYQTLTEPFTWKSLLHNAAYQQTHDSLALVMDSFYEDRVLLKQRRRFCWLVHRFHWFAPAFFELVFQTKSHCFVLPRLQQSRRTRANARSQRRVAATSSSPQQSKATASLTKAHLERRFGGSTTQAVLEITFAHARRGRLGSQQPQAMCGVMPREVSTLTARLLLVL